MLRQFYRTARPIRLCLMHVWRTVIVAESKFHTCSLNFVRRPRLCTPTSDIGADDVMLAHSKGSPYSITERRVPELIPVLGSQPAGDVSHKPGGRLPLLSARPAVTPATLKRAATNFAAW